MAAHYGSMNRSMDWLSQHPVTFQKLTSWLPTSQYIRVQDTSHTPTITTRLLLLPEHALPVPMYWKLYLMQQYRVMGLLKRCLASKDSVWTYGLMPCKVRAGASLPSLTSSTFYQLRIQQEGLLHMPIPWSWAFQTLKPWGNTFLAFVNYMLGFSGLPKTVVFSLLDKRQEVEHAFG